MVYKGHVGIREKKMEATIELFGVYGFRRLGF